MPHSFCLRPCARWCSHWCARWCCVGALSAVLTGCAPTAGLVQPQTAPAQPATAASAVPEAPATVAAPPRRQPLSTATPAPQPGQGDGQAQAAAAETVVTAEADTPSAANEAESVRDSDQQGLASWYGPGFHGRRTANGERFDSGDLTAAHRSLAFGSRVCVRSEVTGKTVVVRINDRGPFVGGRVIDLSQGAAKALGMIGLGIKPVQLWQLDEDEDECPQTSALDMREGLETPDQGPRLQDRPATPARSATKRSKVRSKAAAPRAPARRAPAASAGAQRSR